MTHKGQITIPQRVRDALHLSPGDAVEFRVNGGGEFVLHKSPPAPQASGRRRERLIHPRAEAQRRRRAAELLALLRGLD